MKPIQVNLPITISITAGTLASLTSPRRAACIIRSAVPISTSLQIINLTALLDNLIHTLHILLPELFDLPLKLFTLSKPLSSLPSFSSFTSRPLSSPLVLDVLEPLNELADGRMQRKKFLGEF